MIVIYVIIFVSFWGLIKLINLAKKKGTRKGYLWVTLGCVGYMFLVPLLMLVFTGSTDDPSALGGVTSLLSLGALIFFFWSVYRAFSKKQHLAKADTGVISHKTENNDKTE